MTDETKQAVARLRGVVLSPGRIISTRREQMDADVLAVCSALEDAENECRAWEESTRAVHLQQLEANVRGEVVMP